MARLTQYFNTLTIVVLICLLISVASSCKSRAYKRQNKSADRSYYEQMSEKLGYPLTGQETPMFLRGVESWLGVPYKFGGCDRNGTDCSCFVRTLYREMYKIDLPRKSEDMQKQSKPVKPEDVREGDLVFFKINNEKTSHVGVYISNNRFIHASTSKGVMINSLEENYYKKYFHCFGRWVE
jgi:murein DD-endopeptidase / murein LD-carboxypeptidase